MSLPALRLVGLPLAAALSLSMTSCGSPAQADDAEAVCTDAPEQVALESAPAESARFGDGGLAWTVASGLESWFEGHARRRLAVQLDRPLYRPGDTVWAKGWDLSTPSLSAEGAGQGQRLELVDPRGAVVASADYRQADGAIAGALELPADAPGGAWTLRATSTEGDQLERVFIVDRYSAPRVRKELDFAREAYGPGDTVAAVVTLSRPGGGPLAGVTVEALVQVDGEVLSRAPLVTDEEGAVLVSAALPAVLHRGDGLLTVLVDVGGVTESISRSIPLVVSGLDLRFFPEGGDLVSALPGRVYFEATDRDGQPADVAGRIEDDRGEVVARFRSLHDGLGRVSFTPDPGRTYAAHIEEPAGIDAPVALPAARAEGCVLRSYDDVDGAVEALRVSVRCTAPQPVVVVGSVRDEVLDVAMVEAGPDAPGVVYLRGEAAVAGKQGVARVTAFDADLRPLAERVVYRNPGRSLQVAVTADQDRYGPRDTVQLTVRTTDPDGAPVSAALALSVADDAVLKHADDERGHLLSRLYLEAELPDPLDDPAWYFDPDQPDARMGLDLVMGTKGWRRFAWQEVWDDAAPALTEALLPSWLDDEAERVARAWEPATAYAYRFASGRRATEADWLNWLAPRVAVLAHRGMGLGDAGPGAMIGGIIGMKGGMGGLGARGAGLGGGGAMQPQKALELQAPAGAAPDRELRADVGGARALAAPMDDPAPPPAVEFGSNGDAKAKNEAAGPLRREARRARRAADRDVDLDLDAFASLDAPAATGADRAPPPAEMAALGYLMAEDKEAPMPDHGGDDGDRAAMLDVPVAAAARARPMAAPQPAGHARWDHADNLQVPAPDPVRRRRVVRWEPVREFALPAARPSRPTVRTDFRDTVLWAPTVETGADGTATLSFPLSDAVTTFRVVAEGVGAGLAGRSELELTSALPFTVDTRLPDALSYGDRLLLPVSVGSTIDAPLDVALTAAITGAVHVEAPPPSLTLAAGQDRTVFVPLLARDASGRVSVALTAEAGGLTDAVERSFEVTPRGFPRAFSASGELSDDVAHTVTLGEVLEGTLVADLDLHPGPLSTLIDGLDGLVGMPGGCFEQTSSTNYPNVLVLDYLRAHGVKPRLQVDRERVLSAGYDRLSGYQVASGGFETWGNGPGKEALSAYGLRQFTAMKLVYDGVSDTLLGQDRRYLLQQRDGKGGFRVSGSSAHGYGSAPAETLNAYITWALVTTGSKGLDAELKRARTRARSSDDPYVLALSVATLAHVGDPGAGAGAARLADLQGADGSFPGAASSIMQSGGQNLAVETTALATMALLQAGGHRDAVRASARWLHAQRQGVGTWGSTQATVLALEALTHVARASSATRSPGSVAVFVDGVAAGRVAWGSGQRDTVTLDGLAEHLAGPGPHTVTLDFEGREPLPYTLDVRWRARVPATSAQAPVALTTTLATQQTALGETVRLHAVVDNRTDAVVPSPIARIGLPAGLDVQTWQLEELKERGQIAFWETRSREVTVYWDGLHAGDQHTLDLDLVASLPGSFAGPASSAYAYYDDTHKAWAAELEVAIQP